MKLDVLAIAPHPDDVELFCGATMALLTAKGYRVGILDLTKGELSSQGTPENRAKEAAEAASVLSIAIRENLDIRDGTIDATSDEHTSLLVEKLRFYKPDILFAPFNEDRHPDHVQASGLCDRAVFFANLRNYKPTLGQAHQVLQTCYYQLRTQFSPTFLLNVSEVYQLKLKAINCFSSQLRRSDSLSLVSSPLSLSSISARDEYYGAMLGTKYAEPFKVKTALGLADPVEHFRRNTVLEPLASPRIS